MSKKPLIEMPSDGGSDDRVSMSFKFEKETVDRVRKVKIAVKVAKAKSFNLDQSVEIQLNKILDDAEILLSDHGHYIDDRLTKIKENKKASAANRKKPAQAEIPA